MSVDAGRRRARNGRVEGRDIGLLHRRAMALEGADGAADPRFEVRGDPAAHGAVLACLEP